MDYATPVGVFITDQNLIIQSWDDSLAEMTKIPADQAINTPLTTLVPSLAERGLLSRFQTALKEANAQVLSAAFHHFLIPCPPSVPSPNHEFMQQYVTITPLANHANKVDHLVITVKDVTARVDWEREQARKLAHGSEAERLEAAMTLAQDRDGSTSDLLLTALDDASWRVRRSVTEGLAQRPPDETVSALLNLIRRQHRNAATLNSVIQTLVMADDRVTVPLMAMMDDPDPEVRTYVALALGERRDVKAAPALIRALKDEDTNVRFHSIEALGRIRAVEAVDPLAEIAESGDFFLAFPALDALILIGDSSVGTRLTGLLADEMLRTPVVDALGHLGTDEIVPMLAEQLNNGAVPAPTVAIALAELYNRYETTFGEGSFIADLARQHIGMDGAQALMAALDKSPSSYLRPLIIVLGWLESREVSKTLTRLLGTDAVRQEVVEALVRHGHGVADLLIGQLEEGELEVQKEAATALGRIGSMEAVPALCANLGSHDDLTVICVGALAKIGDSRAFEPVLNLVGHRSAHVRQAAIAALNSLGLPQLADRMAILLTDPNPLVRESSVRIAGYFGFASCLEPLLARNEDEDEQVRRALAEHLPYLDHPDVHRLLAKSSQDNSATVRGAAMRSLGAMLVPQALPLLLNGLHDADPWVRYYAARALGSVGSPEALDALIHICQTDDVSFVRLAAMESLGTISGTRAIAVLAGLMDESDPEIKRTAVQTLGRISHPDALPPLLAAMRSPDADQRREVVMAVGLQEGREAVSALQWTATVDPVPAVVEAAVNSLGAMNTHIAVNTLIDLCLEPNRRELCISALGAQLPSAVMWVAAGLSHPHPGVRTATVEALARMKRPAATDRLRQALTDTDARVRLAAVNALGQLGSWSAERDLASVAHGDPDVSVRQAAIKVLRG